ncbi:MAG: hypothetical protein GXP49_13870 [Deltaproteobacteria bacterium]|nr:hypothetical protein [Deltaproteobacteria bacterium]
MRRLVLTLLSFVLFFGFLSVPAQAKGRHLVNLNQNGEVIPGLAQSWKVAGENQVQFSLKAGTNAKKVQAALKGKLADTQVTVVDDRTVLISGLTPKDLYKRLATIFIGPTEDDPFAALSGLGGDALALVDTDSGSSIRASKRADMSEFMMRDKKKLLLGRVIRVKRGKRFPFVLLEIKILRTARAGPFKGLHGKIKGAPTIAVQGNQVDFTASDTRANTVGWFLKARDRVKFELTGKADYGYKIGYIERK